MTSPIYVTQPHLPPLDEFVPYLEQIWENKILTNGGPFHQQLETALCEFLGVQHISLFTNGTIALMTALRALNVCGEVITTPYSFVATSHAMLWNGIKPVFVDVESGSLNIDPLKIEAAITSNTTAIMPVHCYGQPCDVEAIKNIADRFNLKIIYDAAHAFGVRQNGVSVLNHGDLSVLSFHATKVFNTFEGGAIVSPDLKTKQHVDRLKNFGFRDEITVDELGLNGKMSEISAAFGLLQLKYLDGAIARRAEIADQYRLKLSAIKGITPLPISADTEANYSYFPVLIGDDFAMSRDGLYEHLKSNGVYARRYFYPLISDFPMYRDFASSDPANLPVARDAAMRVLCLPMASTLSNSQVDQVISMIIGALSV